MTKEIKTQITIHAVPEKIWAVLTDFENYPNWNPFITSLSGTVEKGMTITVKIEPPSSSPMTFRPVVLERIENKELRWLGKLLFKGLFDGEHMFELIDHKNGTATFIQSEKFSGLLIDLLNLDKTKMGFEAMNQKLKELVEKK
ncbi:hypothetical protein M2347_002532 [Chryseobacterium sp. H1D6B]|uniref:SRPBCC domain-containing protein n=1 Tax=Chryseobacterium sp. H1D6B TaxID=2940588 RepID=UPI0015C90DC9|nr:SRPBCC domain-containing protein [Chryseobacterium sp. H1D6B]MDH6252805.1 hypothetical protein [Chryseobacterium sp. H1D6B]